MQELETLLLTTEETFIAFDNDVSELRLQLSIVDNTIARASVNGICKRDVLRMADAGYDVTTYEMPLSTFTDKPSTVNYIFAGESLATQIGNGIAKLFSYIYKAIASVFSSIGRFFKWMFAKITGRKTDPAKSAAAAKVLDATNAADILMYLSESSQKAMCKQLWDIKLPLARGVDFWDDKDYNLGEELKKHVEEVDKASKQLPAAVKDTEGTIAVTVEADIANSTVTLLKSVHTEVAVTFPSMSSAKETALLSNFTESLTKLQQQVKFDVDKSKAFTLKDEKMSLAIIKETISKVFKALGNSVTHDAKMNHAEFIKDLDKAISTIEKFGDEAEKQLSKDKTGLFGGSKTAAQLKLTQITIQRSNQALLIAMTRYGYSLLTSEAIVTGAFSDSLETYATEYQANKKAGKKGKIIDIAAAELKPTKKKD